MRKFYFENKAGFENFNHITEAHTYQDCVAENVFNGNRIQLNDEDGIFLCGPSGLGIEFSHDYGESGGDGFYYRNKYKTTQLAPEFVLFFNPLKVEPYKKYRALLDWLAEAKDLYLIYSPYGEEYYRKVQIQRLEKTEINNLGALQIGASVMPVTPWFLPIPIYKNMNPDTSNNKKYDYTYTADLKYGRGSSGFEADIMADGHIPASIYFSFSGSVTNPTITLVGINTNKIYGDCSITATFSSTDKLVLSTIEQDSFVKKIAANGTETDLIDSIDITKEAFFRVPLDEPCTIRFIGPGMSQVTPGTTELKLYQYYRGV